MEQRRLGDTFVSALGLGGAQWSLSDSRIDQESEALLRLALENGVTSVDTAAAYTTPDMDSHNEKLIARVLRDYVGDVVVGTKGGHYRLGDTWPIDGSPTGIRTNCEASLRALEVTELDLFYLHKPDPKVPFEDSVAALEELRLEGKVRRTGVSNVTAQQLAVALSMTPLSAVQNEFSPYARHGAELMRMCAELSIAFLIYSPLGGPNRTNSLAETLPSTNAAAAAKGLSLESVVLSWELAASPAVIPIIGASKRGSLMNSLTAATIELDEEIRDAIARDLGRIDGTD